MGKDETQAYIKRLKECQRDNDEETAHFDADNVLCKILSGIGYNDVVAEWKKVKKYYS